jgi:hypothetical protein
MSAATPPAPKLADLSQQVPAQIAEPDWGAMSERLVEEFPDFTAADVITEIVQARDSAIFVGTDPRDLEELVEFMVRYALQVRSGLISPSDRLQPMPRSRQEAAASA